MSVQPLVTVATDYSRPEKVLILTTGLDLILPCYNPPENWVGTLLQHYEEMQRILAPAPVQLILVNDGSTRNFEMEHIQHLQSAIPDIIIISYPKNRGKGHAVREGSKQGRFDYQVYTDLDFPFGVAIIKRVYEQLLKGTDVVAGVRGAAYLELLPVRRKVITQVSRYINHFLLRLKINDAQAGLKGFNRNGRRILLSTHIDGFLYDSEFIYKAGQDPVITMESLDITCRPGISFSSFRLKLLLQELQNYISILKNNS
ncbi:glycosyltransferase family 2 protein [Chitinophaga sp.]|uniref:glycosyltransferase family 2 protein n=1 Tax=Chitinophaga sp. TaxID=1869181 RepID=UPI0031D9AD2F